MRAKSFRRAAGFSVVSEICVGDKPPADVTSIFSRLLNCTKCRAAHCSTLTNHRICSPQAQVGRRCEPQEESAGRPDPRRKSWFIALARKAVLRASLMIGVTSATTGHDRSSVCVHSSLMARAALLAGPTPGLDRLSICVGPRSAAGRKQQFRQFVFNSWLLEAYHAVMRMH